MNDAYAVQSTAYALLSYIRQEKQDSNTTSLMEWLNTMRNTDGGFASTQVSKLVCFADSTIVIHVKYVIHWFHVQI